MSLHERAARPGYQADLYEVERIMREAALLMEGFNLSADQAIERSKGVERSTTDLEMGALVRHAGLEHLSTATVDDVLRIADLAHARYERSVAATAASTAERDAARCGTCRQVVCPECGNPVPEPP